MKSGFRPCRWMIVGLGSLAILFTSAGAVTCYWEYNVGCCILSNPGPNFDRWCGESTFCPDQATDDPEAFLLLETTESFGRQKNTTNPPACTCVWKVYNCYGSSCAFAGYSSSGTGQGQQVNDQLVCPQGTPN